MNTQATKDDIGNIKATTCHIGGRMPEEVVATKTTTIARFSLGRSQPQETIAPEIVATTTKGGEEQKGETSAAQGTKLATSNASQVAKSQHWAQEEGAQIHVEDQQTRQAWIGESTGTVWSP